LRQVRCKEVRANCAVCLRTNIDILQSDEDPAVMTPSKARPQLPGASTPPLPEMITNAMMISRDHCALLRSAISVIQPRNL
jgi:hypothetical protein